MYLNLTNNETSDIKFEISKFPDGQQSVTLTSSYLEHLKSEEITIKSRLNSFKDLELIICVNQALRNIGVTDIQLYVPYFIGARSDRKFSVGGVNYLKNVICPIINLQQFSKVTVLDPHSDVLEACLNNFEKISNVGLVKWALQQLYPERWDNPKAGLDEIVLVSPDAGALKKVYHVAETFNIPNVVVASKHRDIATGKIISTEVPLTVVHSDKSFVVVDDICDGGRTFIELAKVIEQTYPSAPIYLIITHGIFSAGFSELNKYFDGIFCTNSVKDIGDLTSDSLGQMHKTNTKQQNIF
jgi:ribose-phosphate pyrophosphokinase